ncbi:MAG: competence/damage-inducible protein A [Armatimonadetes bacterium ATM1]|nr:MAG: competence/damage-inducible protein A [Armatimonadota bacterium]MBC6970667.1 competence/damage-inducible protein A [Armatimonadota bacterium]MCE7899612.1 competence/damage-inducible protein A [Armatimonadetes bacterium ATM1]RIJ95399.1 MAG: competence/damage-inducible protein A [Armatimonadota bacterium]
MRERSGYPLPHVNAETISIGNELLFGDICDTHAQTLGRFLSSHGFVHARHTNVRDDVEEIAQAIREALARVNTLICVGGLGPTHDDLTREGIALALNEEIVNDPGVEHELKARYAARNRQWNPLLEKMTMRPKSALAILNPVGSAPALAIAIDDKCLIALPGPKEEFESLLFGRISQLLASRRPSHIVTRILRVVGVPESNLEIRLGDLMKSQNPTVAPYVGKMEVRLRVTASGASNEVAERLAGETVEAICDLLGDDVFSTSDQDLAEVVVSLLKHQKKTLGVGESCTGGMLGARITSVPGSSDVFEGGFITYSNEMKAREVSVARYDLSKFGAVSDPVARQMAEGVRRVLNVDFGIGITGIAGPDGGTPEKPVGLVYIALASEEGTEVQELRLSGDRDLIRYRATQLSLDLLRRRLLS